MRVGLAEPTASVTGDEKVRRIRLAGRSFDPGAGLATMTAELDSGNQVTVTGLLSFSHGRTAAATWIDPAGARWPIERLFWDPPSVLRTSCPPLP